MSETACPQCGAVPLPGSPAGHCARCLAAAALGGAGEAEDAPQLPETGEPQPWTVLGDCELLEEIGRGGMGVVYRARQRRLGREVAVKVLRGGEFASTEARQRFRAEAENAAVLRHPGIVTVHDFGEEQGVCWISMELIAGRNLDDLTRHAPMPARAAAECVRETALAVHFAHGRGVLHRDLKPSNILVDAGGAPHIADFGIARRVEGDSFTRTGQMLGSPGFTAPEQALRGEADARTDVYGLGAILYSILTSRPPFQGPTAESVLVQLREGDPLPPRSLNPSVPRDLETMVLKCLAREPARRYYTAEALADDLTCFLDGRPITARPASSLEKAWRWCRRRPAVAASLALAILAMTAGTVVSLALANRSERFADSAREAARSARQSERESRRLLYTRDMLQAQRELTESNLTGLSLLESHRPLQGGEDLRGWEWHYLHAEAQRSGVVRDERASSQPALSPDGTRMAAGFAGGTVRVRDTATHRIVASFSTGHLPITIVQWLNDGRLLATTSYDADLRLHDAQDGRVLHELPRFTSQMARAVWSADGSWFAYADHGRDVFIHRSDGSLLTRTSFPVPPLLARHPREALVALYSMHHPSIRLLSAEEGTPSRDIPLERPVEWLAWHPHGREAAACFTDGTLRCITMDESATERWRTVLSPAAGNRCAYSSDGATIAAGTSTGMLTMLRAHDGQPLAGPARRSFGAYAHLELAGSTACSASDTGEVHVWQYAATDAAPQTTGAVKAVTWSADGRRLHVTTAELRNGAGRSFRWRHPVWDIPAGKWLPRSEELQGPGTWSPDGSRFARLITLAPPRSIPGLAKLLPPVPLASVEEYPSSRVVKIFRLAEPAMDAVWNPEGTRLAVSCRAPLPHTVVCDLAGGRTHDIPSFGDLFEAPAIHSPFGWSHDGSSLFTATGAVRYNIATGAPDSAWPEYGKVQIAHAFVCAFATRRGHPEVAILGWNGHLEIRDEGTGRVLRQRRVHPAAIRALAWHPHEPRLATACADGTVKLLHAETLEDLLIFEEPGGDARAIAWSPDGLTLASGNAAGRIMLHSARPVLPP